MEKDEGASMTDPERRRVGRRPGRRPTRVSIRHAHGRASDLELAAMRARRLALHIFVGLNRADSNCPTLSKTQVW